MRFIAPYWLFLPPLFAAAGVLLWFRMGRDFHRRLALFSSARLYAPLLNTGVLRRRRLRLGLTAGALIALSVALARPLGGLSPQAASRTGINLLVALDGSRSMLATDVAPSRFRLAQRGINDLFGRLGGDRAGLLLFGGQATLVAPLTFDTVSLQFVNQSMDPEFVGKGGTSLSEVIKRAADYFRSKPGQAKVLLIVSDGEETDGDAVLAAQEAFRKDGLRIFTAGTGTSAGGSIPLLERNLQGDLVRTGVVRDDQGQEVQTRLDEHLLKTVAQVAGGAYVNLAEIGGSFDGVYEKSLHPLAAPMEETPLSDYTEWFQLPLLLALVLLVAEALVARRTRPAAAEEAAVGPVPIRSTAAVVVSVFLLCVMLPRALGSTAEAQRLLADNQPGQAFTLLQAELLKRPDDVLARYNYAVAAYADHKYSAAVEIFEKLAVSAEPEVEVRSCVQLGNSLYRLGEEMRAGNPEGAIVLWQKAMAAYQKAAEVPAAAHNYGKTRADTLALLWEFARSKIAEGDEAARLSPDKGLPAWGQAVAQLDKALKLAANDAEAKEIAAARQSAADRIYKANMDLGGDKRRRAELQKASALEQAIELLGGAIDDYDAALAIRPGDSVAEAAKKQATALLEPWRLELADQQHAAGVAVKSVSLDDAIASWLKAAGNYARVLEQNPANSAAKSGQAENNRTLHDGYVELGDYKQGRAVDPSLAEAERDALLEQALSHYQAALNIEPENPGTREKLMRVGKKLTGVFVARGQAELAQGKAFGETKLIEAIASLERAVQSFGKALQFEPAHAAATAGKKEAEELLRKFRELDARNQRKVLGEHKEMKDPKQIEDPGKLALKLMDFDNNKLSSKKQQNFTAPENKPVKDW